MKKIFLQLLAVTGLFLSCEQAKIEEPGNGNQNSGEQSQEQSGLVSKTFSINIATKTAINPSGNVEWTIDDNFSVFAESSPNDNRKFIISSVNGPNAEMKGEIVNSDSYSALYPYDRKNVLSGGKIYSELPVYQAAAPDTFAEYLSHAVAYTTSDNMTFRQLFALVKVFVPKTDQAVSQIIFKGNADEIIAGKYNVDPKVANPVAVPMEKVTEITLNGTFKPGKNYYFAVFPQTLENGLSIAFKTAGGKEILKSTYDKFVLKSGSITEITESSFVDLGDNLSALGTANCYVITAPGSYYLKTMKGNSKESVGNAVKAEVLWESFGTDTAPSKGDLIEKVSLAGDKLLITTSATYHSGNAVVAVKDASDRILWSWHLWFTKDGFVEHTYNNGAGVAMDRNLGAYSTVVGDVGSIGLLYQWGRKDPFLGSAGFGALEPASTAQWPSPVVSDASVGTIDYTIANPMTFIKGGNPDIMDWLAVADNTRWTDSNAQKSIYDPCPAGWRVPSGTENGLWLKAGVQKGPTTLVMDKGYVFPASISGREAYYPAAGSRKAADGSLDGVGGCGRYWTASSLDDAYTYFLDFWWGELQPDSVSQKANAYSIRCVRL